MMWWKHTKSSQKGRQSHLSPLIPCVFRGLGEPCQHHAVSHGVIVDSPVVARSKTIVEFRNGAEQPRAVGCLVESDASSRHVADLEPSEVGGRNTRAGASRVRRTCKDVVVGQVQVIETSVVVDCMGKCVDMFT